MNFEPIDQNNEPITDEFEKLEFLPEATDSSDAEIDDTAEIVFTPDDTGSAEPPVSFSGATVEPTPEIEAVDPAPPNLEAPVPFELVGTSLFDGGEPDDEIDEIEPVDFDDLEF